MTYRGLFTYLQHIDARGNLYLKVTRDSPFRTRVRLLIRKPPIRC
jgi:hypothetical protein